MVFCNGRVLNERFIRNTVFDVSVDIVPEQPAGPHRRAESK